MDPTPFSVHLRGTRQLRGPKTPTYADAGRAQWLVRVDTDALVFVKAGKAASLAD